MVANGKSETRRSEQAAGSFMGIGGKSRVGFLSLTDQRLFEAVECGNAAPRRL